MDVRFLKDISEAYVIDTGLKTEPDQIFEELYLDHEEDTLIYYLYLLSVVLNPDYK